MSWSRAKEDYSNEEFKPLDFYSHSEASGDLLVPIHGNLDDLFPQEVLFSLHKTNTSHSHNKRTKWTPEEDKIIIEMFAKNGGKWKLIAEHLNNRHADSVKNRFYGTIRKKLNHEQRRKLNRRCTKSKVHSFQIFDDDDDVMKSVFDCENEELDIDACEIVLEDRSTCKDFDHQAKNDKLKGLYNRMAAIQAIITKTKGEINHLLRVESE